LNGIGFNKSVAVFRACDILILAAASEKAIQVGEMTGSAHVGAGVATLC
jgi:hypothetical protein